MRAANRGRRILADERAGDETRCLWTRASAYRDSFGWFVWPQASTPRRQAIAATLDDPGDVMPPGEPPEWIRRTGAWRNYCLLGPDQLGEHPRLIIVRMDPIGRRDVQLPLAGVSVRPFRIAMSASARS